MARAWRPFLLCLVGHACGFEDAAALIQQQQFVGALEAPSAPQERAEALPDPGFRGYRVSRMTASAEDGGSVLVNFSNFCEQHDAYGPKECVVYYGIPVHKTIKLHLASGLKLRDIVHTSWDLRLSHNTKDAWSFMVPESMFGTTNCQLCQGSCHYEFANARYMADVTVPTTLDGTEMCNNNTEPLQQDFVLEDRVMHPFQIPENLKLEGNITHGFGILNEDGSVRAHGSYLYRLSTGPGSIAASLFSKEEASIASEQEEVLRPAELLAEVLLPQVLLGPAMELAEHIGMPEMTKKDGAVTNLSRTEAGHVLAMNVSVNMLPAGSSIVIAAESGCSVLDTSGSVTCLFPASGTINISSAANISILAEEGSTMHLGSKMTLGRPEGVMNTLYADRFARREVHSVLCSNGSKITVKDFKGKNHTYVPGRCGRHSFFIANIAPHIEELNDFANFALPSAMRLFYPLAPKTFDELLPIKQEIDVELKHKNGTTFLSLGMSIALLPFR